MTTYLIGGLLFLGMLISVIQPIEVSQAIEAFSAIKGLLPVYSGVAVLIMSIPMGYVVNQAWMAFYNIFLDVHKNIFTLPPNFAEDIRLNTTTSWGWKRAYLNEIRLALFHRKSAPLDSNAVLSWHRNRLNTLHSNGTVAFSFFIGLISCLLISQFLTNYNWFIHPASKYMRERWWLLIAVSIAIITSIIRMVRSYKLIVLYNQALIQKECPKCSIFCDTVSKENIVNKSIGAERQKQSKTITSENTNANSKKSSEPINLNRERCDF